ncbi:Zinc finger protein [Apiospora saccharicola]
MPALSCVPIVPPTASSTPHAAYSDAGKLLCKLCHEAIKSESLWDGHLRSTAHRQKLTALQQQSTSSTSSSTSRPAAAPTETTESPNTITTTTTTINHKRKHGVDEDDIDMDEADGAAGEDAARKKKSRMDTPQRAVSTGAGERASNTPPSLTRRTSNAPEKGVEIAIPSRPATPQLSGRSPLIGSGSEHSTSTPNTSHGGRGPTSAAATTSTTTTTAASAAATQKSIDEAEWALFEAEIANGAEPTPPPPSTLPNPGGAAGDAVISAPALTADQLAAKSQEEEHERRKLRFEVEIADEREDATRALEDEFDEMEELEARVRKLKEKREELRKGSMANLRAAAADGGKSATMKARAVGKENGGWRRRVRKMRMRMRMRRILMMGSGFGSETGARGDD